MRIRHDVLILASGHADIESLLLSAEPDIPSRSLDPFLDYVAAAIALEATCYAPGNSVGVRETSRLISRLRHRQLGVLITTSHLNAQAYKEIREDGHPCPVVILAGRDVVGILKAIGFDSPAALKRHLRENYPPRLIDAVDGGPQNRSASSGDTLG